MLAGAEAGRLPGCTLCRQERCRQGAGAHHAASGATSTTAGTEQVARLATQRRALQRPHGGRSWSSVEGTKEWERSAAADGRNTRGCRACSRGLSSGRPSCWRQAAARQAREPGRGRRAAGAGRGAGGGEQQGRVPAAGPLARPWQGQPHGQLGLRGWGRTAHWRRQDGNQRRPPERRTRDRRGEPRQGAPPARRPNGPPCSIRCGRRPGAVGGRTGPVAAGGGF